MKKIFKGLGEVKVKKAAFILAVVLFFSALFFFAYPVLSHAAGTVAANPTTNWQNPPPSLSKIYEVLGTNNGGVGHTIRILWVRMMQIVNSLVVVVLIFVAFAEIMRLNINTYGIKKILPTLVLAVVAANFSYIICRFVIDIGNVALTLFLQDTDTKCITNGINVSIFFKDDVDSTIKALNTTKSAGQSGGLLTALAIVIFSIVAAVITLILAFLFAIRNYVLYLLVIVSPIAFMAMILPQTKTYFNQWWDYLSKWTFMPVVSIAIIWMGGQLLKLSGTNDGSLMGMVLSVAMLVLAIQVPFKLGGSIMQKWGDLGKKAWGSTGGAVAKKIGGNVKDYWTNKAKGLAMRAGNNWKMVGLNMVRKGNGFQQALGGSFLFGAGGDKAKAEVAFEEDFSKGLTEGFQARHMYTGARGRNNAMRAGYRDNRTGEQKEFRSYAEEDIFRRGGKQYDQLKEWRLASGHARRRMAMSEKHMNDMIAQGTFASIEGKIMSKSDESPEAIAERVIKANEGTGKTPEEIRKLIDDETRKVEDERKDRVTSEFARVMGMTKQEAEEWRQFQQFVATESESTERLKGKAEKDILVKPTMDQIAIHEQAELSQETAITRQRFQELSKDMQDFITKIKESGRTLSEMTYAERQELQTKSSTDQAAFAQYLNNQGRATVRLREMGILNETEDFAGTDSASDLGIADTVKKRENKFIEEFVKPKIAKGIPAYLSNLIDQDSAGNIQIRRMERTTYTRGLGVASEKTSGRVTDYSGMSVDTLANLMTAGDKKDGITAEMIRGFLAGEATGDSNKRSRMMAMVTAMTSKLASANDATPAAQFIISRLGQDSTGKSEAIGMLHEIEKADALGAQWAKTEAVKGMIKEAQDARDRGDIGALQQHLVGVYSAIPQNNRGAANAIIKKFVRKGSY